MSSYHRTTHREHEAPHGENYAKIINTNSPQFSKMGDTLNRNRIEKPTDKVANKLVEGNGKYIRQKIDRSWNSNIIVDDKAKDQSKRIRKIRVK